MKNLHRILSVGLARVGPPGYLLASLVEDSSVCDTARKLKWPSEEKKTEVHLTTPSVVKYDSRPAKNGKRLHDGDRLGKLIFDNPVDDLLYERMSIFSTE